MKQRGIPSTSSYQVNSAVSDNAVSGNEALAQTRIVPNSAMRLHRRRLGLMIQSRTGRAYRHADQSSPLALDRTSPFRSEAGEVRNRALLPLSGQTAFGRNWLNTCRSTLSPGTWWILFHAVLDFGDSGSGTFFIKVSTGRTADTDRPDSVSAYHDVPPEGGFCTSRARRANEAACR